MNTFKDLGLEKNCVNKEVFTKICTENIMFIAFRLKTFPSKSGLRF